MADQDEDLDALGLVAHSYDSLFSVRSRLYSVGDFSLPTRQGITYGQIGVAILTFIVSVIVFGLIVNPILTLFNIRDPWITLAFLLVPPFLVAQRITKSMPYRKSVGGSVMSVLRYYLDDKVHRRGTPIPRNRRPSEMQVLHYGREWVLAENYAALVPGEGDYSDRETEKRLADMGEVIDLQPWYNRKAFEHLVAHRETRATQAVEVKSDVHYRRGVVATVTVPELDKEEA